MPEYDVLREHLGDRNYLPGDTRTASKAEVAHLVRNGVLRAEEEKAAAPPANKAAPKPDNKAAPAVANKSKD